MELNPGSQTPQIRRRLKNEGKREAVELRNIFSMHFFEDRESTTRIIGSGESTNERVVHERIWVRRLREEATSVVEAIGDHDGEAEEEFSGEERVRFEAGLAGEGVDLLGGFEGLAFAQ
ncbi:hypothetical protein TIFTF001_045778 [Ficus carica]|uniref:Uncharacterized protein n=1 Tax=Ficus carica TaxID=3494 RepID=A0AA87YUJ4_FICCA|nr:hypothetical protein TIFTF001_045771 [Ficus carica]GMN23456.1 hypothetical protein TIFTF001_045778 [Ficus carica]